MTNLWEIYVVEYARLPSFPATGVLYGAHDELPSAFPFSFVVAKSGAGVVLCDCGFTKDGDCGILADKFGIETWVSPVEMLAQLSISANDVTALVLSHAHFDHMGAIKEFPNAHVYLQRKEMLSWIEAMALPSRYGFLRDALATDNITDAILSGSRYRLTLIDGDKDNVLPGVHVRLAPGHTMGQQFIILDSSKGQYVVSGDCIYSVRNLTGEGRNTLGHYVPLGNGVGSVWDQLTSFDRLEQAVGGDLDRIIILHDQRRWPKFEKVLEFKGLEIRRVA